MKNWIKGIAAGVLVLGLSACNTTAEPKKDPETGKKVEVQNESKMTAQEVYEKVIAASEEQKSMHAKMDIDQAIEVPSEDFNMTSTIKMDMDMIVDPLAMYQKMSMDMGEQGTMDTEIYMTEEGFFMHDPENDQWLKMPAGMSEDMMAQMGNGADPTLDMKMFKDFVEDFEFEQTDDEYILTLVASGEKFTSLIQKTVADNMPAGMEMGEEETEMMKNMKVEKLNYKIFIDKKTFYTNAFDMDMDMTMTIEGNEMHIVQKMNAVISKINEIDTIKVPQEVLDKTVDIGEMNGQ
ncbi:DUF6612 domain-containing protein [Filibacter tadaridae]|uniref:Lipoprotein n=1 Tax=Filibacter tadaridae TaxID=2483811 RepID=A0A3P5W9E0_9BACL|nr:DUF6612 family protein [Filibacter tadaridae]VDC20043.1 hypothetical protein FILTAD_00463 [Filibacter tadaridae]